MSVLSTIRRVLGRGASEEGPSEPDVEFQRRSVSQSAEHELSFYGGYRYVDAEGHEHSVKRIFDVYTDEDHLEDGKPVAVVSEDHHVDRDGEEELVDSREFEVVVEVDPEAEGRLRETQIQSFVDGWHREHVDVE